MKLTVKASATTQKPAEAVFQILCAPAGLDWIESPWSLIDSAAIDNGSVLLWRLGRRTARTRVSIERPTAISWQGDGIEGALRVESAGAETAVHWTGSFRVPAGGLTDLVFGFFIRGRMTRMAS